MTTYDFSATGVKYPLENSPVNVHGDFKKLAESLDAILPAYGVSYFQINVHNNSGAAISNGVPVYATTGKVNGKVTIAKALPSTTAPILGLLKNNTLNGSDGIVVVAGVGICAIADSVNGIVIVEAKGNGTWGALRDGLS
jgi:hypothetical protein